MTIGADLAPDVGNAGGIQSLKDLGDYTKTADPGAIKGLTTDAAGIAGKFSDMGASFPNMGSASSMLSKISVPDIPKLNAAAPDLTTLMGSYSGTLNSLTGVSLSSKLSPNLGPNGLPSIVDFVQPVCGGPAFNGILNSLNTSSITDQLETVNSVDALDASIAKSTALFNTAGIDLNNPPLAGLGSSMNFATNLHKFGTSKEIIGLLGNIANTKNQYGESINSSLAEGRNNALLSQNGIPPLNFNNLPTYTGEDSSLNTNAGAKLLGG
jgi:hypothetical protein